MSNVEMMNFSFQRSSLMVYVFCQDQKSHSSSWAWLCMPIIPALGSGDRRIRSSGSSSGYIKLDCEFGASLGYMRPCHIKKRKRKLNTRKVPNLTQYELSWKGENSRGST